MSEHLPRGRYRLTFDVETDGHGMLFPHDTAAMTMLDWWTERGARFVSAEDCEAIERGRREQRIEHERLIARVQELQAKVNHLTKLHDERDAIERNRPPVSSQDTPPAPRPEPRVYRCAGDVPPYLESSARLRTRSGALYGRNHPTDAGWWKSTDDGALYGDPVLLTNLPEHEWPLTEMLSESVSTDTDGTDR